MDTTTQSATTTLTGAYLIRNAEGLEFVLARNPTREDAVEVLDQTVPGYWTHIGFISEGIATQLTPGVEFQWRLWDRPAGYGAERVRVVKVNRVTVRLEAVSDGFRVDLEVR